MSASETATASGGEGARASSVGASGGPATPSAPTTLALRPADVGGVVAAFQKLLGPKWDKYQTAVSMFLVGRLTRDELLEEVGDMIAQGPGRRLHNQLLVGMLANSFKSHPMDGMGGGFGSQRRRKMSRSSQWDQIKKVVLSLPIRERMRIKAITRESGKRGLTSNVIVQTRQALVPRIPIVTSSAPELQNKNLARTMVSVKDILDMVNAPLMSEAYELPERGALRDRMIGAAREYGVLGSVSLKAADVLYLGLQYHLKAIVGAAIDNLVARSASRSRGGTGNGSNGASASNNGPICITLEDMADTFTLAPNLTEPFGSMDLLTDAMLRNDDDYDILARYREESTNTVSSATSASIGPNATVAKLSPISYLLKPTAKTGEGELGSHEELQWLINDILAGE